MGLVIVGAALAGFVQGLSGSNFGLVAMAFWVWTLDPGLIGPLVVCGSLTGQLLSLFYIRQKFDFHLLLPFIAGGAVGVPIGVLLLHHIDPVLFRLAVGILLVIWCPAMLFARAIPRVVGGGRLADATIGVTAGVMGGLGGLTGPAPALWTTLRHWERDKQRAVMQGFNLAMQALTMLTYIASGAVSSEALSLFPVVAAAVWIPTWIGARLYGVLSDRLFRTVVLGLLSASGAILIATTLPKLL